MEYREGMFITSMVLQPGLNHYFFSDQNDRQFIMDDVEQKDIDVSIASNVLTIIGTKKEEKEEKKGNYYKKESLSGSFQRTLSLPAAVDGEKVAAQLENGFLSISIPKKEESKPKQITVNVQ